MVFLDYTQGELDRQYDQRAWVTNAVEIIRRYRDNSDAVRARLGEPDVYAYGDTPSETLDLFRTDRPNAPIQVFIHGGAWRLLSKRDSAFAAETFVRAGAHFIALDFALVPNVPLAEMAAQVRRAIAWIYRNTGIFGGNPERIFVSGHSSGAHLAATAVVTDWPALFALPRGIVKGALCASGVYDLRPVRLSARNDYLRIDAKTEQDLSPLRHLALLDCPVLVAHAELETPEFVRQSREFAAALGPALSSPIIVGKGQNHFEVVETLADPGGALGRAALLQMGLASE